MARQVAAVAVVMLLLALATRHIDLRVTLREFSFARFPWLMASLFMFLAILPLWAWQWALLAEQRGARAYNSMLSVVASTSSVLNSTAFLVGEATAVLLLTTHARLNRYQALSVLALDQFLVGCAKIVVIAIAALQISLPDTVKAGALVLVAGVVLIAAAGLLLTLSGNMHGLAGKLGARLAPFRHPQQLILPFAIALAKKAVEALAILCVQHAFGINLPAGSALVVLAMTNLATLLPVVPGNIGVYEGAVTVAYAQFGIPPERSLALAGVQHLCYWLALALPGYVWGLRMASVRSAAAIS